MLKAIPYFPRVFIHSVMLTFIIFLFGAHSRSFADNNTLPDFTTVVDQVGDSVVNIITIKREGTKLIPDELRDDIENTPLMGVLREMFGSQLDEKLSGKTPGLGSGSVVSKDGYIITNLHVVEGADEIYVRLHDSREYAAKIIGKDSGTDLALIKIEADDLTPLVYASEENIKVGQWVLAIGSPYGFEHTVTAGIISATGRSLGAERYVPFIQTDVAINPGNSGGGLFNLKGELVGINSQIISESGGYAGLSFAVPSQVIRSVIDQLKTTGTVARGWMGLAFQDLNRDLAASFGIKRVQGALISKVITGSPAEIAGLKLGDVIIKFNGNEVKKATDLPPMVGLIPIDTSVDMTVIRNSKEMQLSLKIKTYQQQVVQANYSEMLIPQQDLKKSISQGILVRNLDDYEKRGLETNQKGVIVVRVMDQEWTEAGIRSGDVILSLNHQNVEDADRFYNLLIKSDTKIIPVLVTRPGEIQRFIPVKRR
ncbi:MAG: Do family serine endopeptidase [Candidatus Berkiella sp.]